MYIIIQKAYGTNTKLLNLSNYAGIFYLSGHSKFKISSCNDSKDLKNDYRIFLGRFYSK